MEARLIALDSTIYVAKAVRHAIDAFANLGEITLVSLDPLRIRIETSMQVDRVVDEFLNYALLASLDALWSQA